MNLPAGMTTNRPALAGTIHQNGVEVPMLPYGCHHTRAPDKFKADIVFHSKGNVSWPARMSKSCQYDRIDSDARCDGCQHPKGNI